MKVWCELCSGSRVWEVHKHLKRVAGIRRGRSQLKFRSLQPVRTLATVTYRSSHAMPNVLLILIIIITR